MLLKWSMIQFHLMKNNSILFSIIVPAYNRKSHLEMMIPKIEKINYDNWELIIVDDGSNDGTEQLFKSIDDDKVIYIKQINKERGAARNAGFKIAKGDYVTFLDSDDYLLPNVFIEALDVIDRNPGIPLFHLGFEMRNLDEDLLQEAEILPAILNNMLIEKNAIACLGVFIKRDVAELNPFEERRDLSGTEDYELWLRLASRYPFLHFNKTIAVLVQHESRSMLDADIDKTIKRIITFIDLVLNNPVVLKFIDQDLNKFIAHRYSYISLHAAEANHKKIAISYLFKSITKSPILFFRIRLYIILKKIIFK